MAGVPSVIEIEEEIARYAEIGQGHECLFVCALHVGELIWLELVCYVGKIGKILASSSGQWQKISFVWKDGKRVGAIRKDDK